MHTVVQNWHLLKSLYFAIERFNQNSDFRLVISNLKFRCEGEETAQNRGFQIFQPPSKTLVFGLDSIIRDRESRIWSQHSRRRYTNY